MSANKKKALLGLLVGVLIAVLSFIIPLGKTNSDNENYMVRNEFGEGEKEVFLTAVTPEGEIPITYNVAERIYTQEEVETMLPEFISCIESMVLGENPSPEMISTDLNFVDCVEGYPFEVAWFCNNTELVGTQGKIKTDIKEPTGIVLTAEFEYENYFYEHSFPIVLVPKEVSAEETQLYMIEEALQKADKESQTKKTISLPERINGSWVQWKRHSEKKVLKIAGLCVAVSIFFFFADSVEKKEDAKRRRAAVRNDYPEFALKCSMLIGSGMTLRQVFNKIGKAYASLSVVRRPLYEEVLVGIRELESGLAERQVYENFGRRCGIRETERFGHLLSRNLRKGADGLKNALRKEAEDAMELKKEEIRKQGETAGTRLLFPMLILLLIVMVIIMIPAFSAFNI